MLVMALVAGSISSQGLTKVSAADEVSGEDIIHYMDEMDLPEDESTTEAPQEESSEVTTKEITTEETTKKTKTKKITWNGKVVKNATMKGIDVSHHNGNINWKKVAASDIDYAIIRCGYGTNTKKQDDQKWKRNIAGCEKYKIPYGVYIYSYATSVAEARSEAEHVLRMVKGLKMSFPIYYDMEDNIQARLSNKKKKKIAETFLGIITQHGYECGVYANLNWWTTYLKSIEKYVYYKWVARYGTKCGYKGVYQMWQCSATDKVKGISGYTDLNFWYDQVRTSDYNIYVAPKVKRPAKVVVKKVTTGRRWATVTWSHRKKAVGYKLQYSGSKKFKKYVTRYTNGTSMYISGLKPRKYYYFRIKAYLFKDGKRFYSKEWSKVIRKKIK
jgi:GH25 family lysozyme M1 (1,4-beta-N-acetylmuramidase)